MVYEVAMIMLGAASPGALLAYRSGVEKLHGRWPQFWHRIAVAEALARSTQWDRLMEDRLSADERDPTFMSERAAAAQDVWDKIVEDSAFTGCSGGGPLAEWWEENLWFGLNQSASGIATTLSTQPAPQHLLYSVGASSTQDGAGGGKGNGGRNDRAGGALPHVQARGDRQEGQGNGPTCFNCLTVGHHYWNCTRLTGTPLNAVLQAALDAKGAGRGGGGGRGNGGGGRGAGGGGAGGGGNGGGGRGDGGGRGNGGGRGAGGGGRGRGYPPAPAPDNAPGGRPRGRRANRNGNRPRGGDAEAWDAE